LGFVPTAIQIASVAHARLEVAHGLTEFSNLSVDAVLTAGTISATAIERTVYLSLKVFRQPIQPVNRIAHIPIIAIALIVGIAIPLCGCGCRQR
jgi:hypothetical protein